MRRDRGLSEIDGGMEAQRNTEQSTAMTLRR